MRARFECVGSPQAEPNGFGRTLRRQLAFDRAAGQANRAENYGFATICHQKRSCPPAGGAAGEIAEIRERATPKFMRADRRGPLREGQKSRARAEKSSRSFAASGMARACLRRLAMFEFLIKIGRRKASVISGGAVDWRRRA